MADFNPITVVETPEFLNATHKLLDQEDRAALVDHVAHHPSAGTVIPGTGGLRKLRWGLEGRGKRGGARIIYFFHNPYMPLFLLTAYAKNERDDLSRADYAAFQQLTQMLVDSYRTRRLKP
jgi:hypothetical protein